MYRSSDAVFFLPQTGSEIAGKFNLLLESLRRNGGAPRCIPRDDKDGEITKISKEMITRMPPEWDVRESYVMTKLKYPVDYTLDVIIMGEASSSKLASRDFCHYTISSLSLARHIFDIEAGSF